MYFCLFVFWLSYNSSKSKNVTVQMLSVQDLILHYVAYFALD